MLKTKTLLFNAILLMTLSIFTMGAHAQSDSECRASLERLNQAFDLGMNVSIIGKVSFEDLNLSVEDVNNLSTNLQGQVYNILKPLDAYARDFIVALQQQIENVTRRAYLTFTQNSPEVIDALMMLRTLKTDLEKTCL